MSVIINWGGMYVSRPITYRSGPHKKKNWKKNKEDWRKKKQHRSRSFGYCHHLLLELIVMRKEYPMVIFFEKCIYFIRINDKIKIIFEKLFNSKCWIIWHFYPYYVFTPTYPYYVPTIHYSYENRREKKT